jgi:hypothetical protein
MIEPNPHERRGGGGGRGAGGYHGLDLEHLEERFEQCVREPSMRSASAILRITREQIMARGQLSVYPKLTYGFLLLGGILFGVSPWLSPDLKKSAMPAAAGCIALAAILAYGAVTSHRERRASIVQEREIYRLATEALERLLVHPFPRKPLTREQVDTLKDLIRRSPNSTALRELLNESA